MIVLVISRFCYQHLLTTTFLLYDTFPLGVKEKNHFPRLIDTIYSIDKRKNLFVIGSTLLLTLVLPYESIVVIPL